MRNLLLALLTLSSSPAQEVPLPPPLEAVVMPEVRLAKRIVFLVDGSASMNSHFQAAVHYATGLASQGSDDYEVNVMLFGSTSVVWPDGWVKMPDLEQSKKMLGWLLLNRNQVGSQTYMSKALQAAYALDKDASVIVITDGDMANAVPDEVPEGRIVAVLQVEHVNYDTFITWAKKLKGGLFRVPCKHNWHMSEEFFPKCSKCGKSNPNLMLEPK